jgi:hypothetical protein
MEKTEDTVKLSTGKAVRIHTWPMRPACHHVATVDAMQAPRKGGWPIPEDQVDNVVAAITDGCDLSREETEGLSIADTLKLFIAIGGLNCRPLVSLFSPQRISKRPSTAPHSN